MSDGLAGWRNEINELDAQLIKILQQRFAVVEHIANYKREHNLPVRDEKREEDLMNGIINKTSLSPNFVKDLYSILFNYSYLIEQ